MNEKLKKIAEILGIESESVADIVAAITGDEPKELENNDVQSETEKEELKEEIKEEVKKEIIEELKTETLSQDTKDDEDEEKKELKLSLLKLSNDKRKLEIDSLVKDGYISVAIKNLLEKKYCNNDTKLSLSQVDNAFENIVEVVKMQGKMRYGEHTGGQVLECSLNKESNPLIKDAENRNKNKR